MKNFFEKNKKAIIIGSAVLVVGVIVFIILKKTTKVSIPLTDDQMIKKSTGVVYPIGKKLGADTNADERVVIMNIQKYINSKLTYQRELVVDGIFGAETEALAQQILGVKAVSYSLYNEILAKLRGSINI